MKHTRGFTILFATLVAALSLAIGLAIYDLAFREIALSSLQSQSQQAIYAADTGAECALYWDSKYISGSAFASSSASSDITLGTGSNIYCNSQDIVNGSGTAWNPKWSILDTATAATTTFQFSMGTTSSSATVSSPCVTVLVAKYQNNPNSPNVISTTITSEGFNSCVSSSLQVERELQVKY